MRTEDRPSRDMKSTYTRLVEIVRGLESILIACSGGADSTLLLRAGRDAGIPVLAVTGLSPSTPSWDRENARKMAELIGVPHRFIRTSEMDREEYRRNTPRRCFYCKDTLFRDLTRMARQEGFRWVVDGSNADDTSDHRPGREAARRHRVRSPLMEAGMGKEEIREISRALGLPTWDRPASPCLASRIPYNIPVTPEALQRIERAEAFLHAEGLQEVRVRDHGEIARIEVNESDIGRFLDESFRQRVVRHLMNAGFRYVSLDLEGFISGKLNRI